MGQTTDVAIRAKAGSGTGSAGQSLVKAAFEKFDWAVHTVDQEHDWGTDLWVMPFDNERFSTASLIGVQVKASSDMTGKYFREPKEDSEGHVTGWWFRPDKADHLDEWRRHSVPHILVVCCLATGDMYWERVSDDTIVRTPTSGKVLVPAVKRLAPSSKNDLLTVAAEGRRQALWEGTIWDSSDTLPPDERIRAALICPRLVSPHPNRVASPLDPAAAIAMLVQVRVDELDRTHQKGSLPLVPETPASHQDWRWRLYGALRTYLSTNDDPAVFDVVAEQEAPTTDEVATFTAVRASALMEHGRADEALSLLDVHLTDDELNPLDRLWLLTQRAWSMYELGRNEEAAALASELQVSASLHRPDPTATALGASGADLIFASKQSLAPEDLADALNGSDTAVDWWREQALGRGGIARADADFKKWARPDSFPHERGGAWRALRSATLMAAFAANRNSWRRASQRLAQEQLVREEALSEESARDSLQMLRLAGATKEVEMVTHRLLRHGPARYLRLAAGDVVLDRSTTTSLTADIAFLQKAGDVVDASTADQTLQWALNTLNDLEGFQQRHRPRFRVADKVLDLVAAITPSLSPDGREALQEHLAVAPVQEDQLSARGYAAILDSLEPHVWPRDLVATLSRREGDNFELADAIDHLAAAHDSEQRESLLGRIQSGDLAALHAFGDVRDLPTNVATKLVDHLASQVADIVDRAPGYTISSHFPLHSLVLLNVHHPKAASWHPVIAAISHGAGSPNDLAGTLRLLTAVVDQLPVGHYSELTAAVQTVSEMTPAPSFFNEADFVSVAQDTLNVLAPGTSTFEDILVMLRGGSDRRVNAVLIVARRKEPTDLPLLGVATLLNDGRTTAMVAHCLTRWVCEGVARDESLAMIETLLDECGAAVAQSVTAILKEAPPSAGADRLADLLEDHVSATARAEVGRYRRRRVHS